MGSARVRLTRDDLLRLGLPPEARIIAADMGEDRDRGEPVLTIEHPQLRHDRGEAMIQVSRTEPHYFLSFDQRMPVGKDQ